MDRLLQVPKDARVPGTDARQRQFIQDKQSGYFDRMRELERARMIANTELVKGDATAAATYITRLEMALLEISHAASIADGLDAEIYGVIGDVQGFDAADGLWQAEHPDDGNDN